MKQSRLRGAPALAGLLLVFVLVAAFQLPAPPGPPAVPGGQPTRSPTVALDGQDIPVPVTINPSGPLVALEPLAQRLGGEVIADESGESTTLRIEQTDVVLGLGSAIITVGEKLVSLTQPPVRGDGGILVPLDFLRNTWGDLLGYAFEWRPEASRLLITRRGARELTVVTDVVHQQGITTVVLQFAEVPRYRIERQAGEVRVQMIADRLAVPFQRPLIVDPLVREVAITPEQVRVQLMPGAEAQSYVLENPFRIVLDVHQPSSVDVPTPTMARPRDTPRLRTIVIDPGHGGTETGAIGPSGIQEKELTLILARDLEARLEQSGFRVILTRNEDASVPHDNRTAIANQNKADLFISIHLNSSLGSGAYGAETYFLSAEPTDATAARAAATENTAAAENTDAEPAPEADPQAMADLELILWDLAQSHHMAESQRFAKLVQGELNQTLQLRDRGVKQAPFRVLMGAAMPAVLVELGFLSNPDEEKKLQDPEYRGNLIAALARAVQRYKALVENRPDPTAPSPSATPGAAPGGGGPLTPVPPSPTPSRPPGEGRPLPPLARSSPVLPPSPGWVGVRWERGPGGEGQSGGPGAS
ncbi:MAG TPA: N-acetylmuramoyl-L-alanine amidase [Thermoanaerobaculia bacterium]|nr:N-acetylmuramoyl-L-alanine amidase [Thermoanaerobaculia bacterium]